jgi:hypothetical protein
MLDIWPLWPIAISIFKYKIWHMDNIFAALEHSDRICTIDLFNFPRSNLKKVLVAMQQPFPALTSLGLQPRGKTAPVLVPESFLGRSAPRLQRLTLDRILFPGLTELLLSATRLTQLTLWRVPHSFDLSPMDMVTCLSGLTSLESLVIEFKSPPRYQRSQHDPPPPTGPTHILLPIFTSLRFSGTSEYLDDLVAWINAPLLDNLDITFFDDEPFDTSQLAQLIRRAPKFKAHDEALVVFSWSNIRITLPRTFDGRLHLDFLAYIYGVGLQREGLQRVIPSVSHLHGETPLHP